MAGDIKTATFMVSATNVDNVYVAVNKDGEDVTLGSKGDTASRPASNTLHPGYFYFDTTIGQPTWWSGSAWVDAIGNIVQ